MTEPEQQQLILALLQRLCGLEPLKQLFWSELNYQRVNQSLSRRGWADSATGALAEDPVLFAAGGTNNDFHVIYARLASDKLLLGQERPVVSRLLRDHPYALFMFSDSTQSRWHFLNVKYDDQSDKRRLFRRITIGPEERFRTASERLALLDLASISPDLSSLSPLAIQERHDEAFDVEAVTKQFFEEYKAVFGILQDDLMRQTRDRLWAHDYALQFLNRCMFLYFVQRKRWLGNDIEFLRSFWRNYKVVGQVRDSFFDRWLKVLFFEAFNNQFHGGHRHFPDPIKTALALAPYLNGGLFLENDLDRQYAFTLTDARFEQVFTFLERYNFTISEDSPLDLPRELKARITRLKSEKLKFHHSDPTCQFRSVEQAREEERMLFRDILDARRYAIEQEMKGLRRKIEIPTERQMRLGIAKEQAHPMQSEIAGWQSQLDALAADLDRISHARAVLKPNTPAPFVWDIAFVEVFEGYQKGFDIVIGNPPYVRNEYIADPSTPREAQSKVDRSAYKAKLAAHVYKSFPRFFHVSPRTGEASRGMDLSKELPASFCFAFPSSRL